MENIKKGLLELIPYVVIIILVLLVKQFIVSTVYVHGSSMENTLHDKDIMILDKIGTRISGIKRFDIIAIKTNREKIIKRVIGLPGETISYKDNQLYINGKKYKEKITDKYTTDIAEITLEKDQYYVLGDNRVNSLDSRYFGPISRNQILGHARFIIFPFNRFGAR